MIDQLVKIADFLDKNNRKMDADLIDYIIHKYASDDLNSYFDSGLDKSIPQEEREDLESVLDGLAEALGKKRIN